MSHSHAWNQRRALRPPPRPPRPPPLPTGAVISSAAPMPPPPRSHPGGAGAARPRAPPPRARTQPAARLPAEGSRGRRPPPPPPTLDAATSSAAAGSRGPPPGARSHADKRTGKRTRAGSKKKNWSGRDKSRNDQRTNAVLELDKQTQAFPSTTVGRGRYKKTTSSFLPERPTSASSAAASAASSSSSSSPATGFFAPAPPGPAASLWTHSGADKQRTKSFKEEMIVSACSVISKKLHKAYRTRNNVMALTRTKVPDWYAKNWKTFSPDCLLSRGNTVVPVVVAVWWPELYFANLRGRIFRLRYCPGYRARRPRAAPRAR
jgi:hypothetical protein